MSKRQTISDKQLIKQSTVPPSIQKMIGQRYSRLLVTSYAGFRKLPSGQRYHYVWCDCSCGSKVLGNTTHIRFGKWHSCGCLRVDYPNRFKHGFAPLVGKREKIYNTWKSINSRCYNKNSKAYAAYGGAGKRVCEGWRGEHGFEHFKMDMSPVTDKSIDRIDNDLHYSCGHCDECNREGWRLNCRWGNDELQSNNRGQFNNKVVIDGKEMTFTQGSRYLGFPHKTLQSRIKHLGWSIEKAISTPLKIRP